MSRFVVLVVGLLLFLLAGCASSRPKTTPTVWPAAGVLFAGARSSEYGIEPFPAPEGWGKGLATLAGYLPGAQKAAIWIVGTVSEETGAAQLEFPGDGHEYPHVTFAAEDRHEEYLRYFDEHDIQVFLQVEPGLADVPTLIDLVLNRYGQHPSVIGFGVDVEWYKDTRTGGIPVTNTVAQEWEERVKAHNPAYRLFLKHWLSEKMPPAYREGMMFLDDSQMFDSLDGMVGEFKAWGKTFAPTPVGFQYGYRSDREWWDALSNPPKEIGQALINEIPNVTDLYWVDFTAEEIWPQE